MPRAACFAIDQISILDGKETPLPFQATVLERRPNCPICWGASRPACGQPGGISAGRPTRTTAGSVLPAVVRVTKVGARLIVETGEDSVMEVVLSKDCLLGVRGRREHFERPVSVVAAGKGGSAARVRVDGAREEAAGPLRATVLVDGAIEFGTCTLRLEARLHFFASFPRRPDPELTVRNPRRALHRGGFWGARRSGIGALSRHSCTCRTARAAASDAVLRRARLLARRDHIADCDLSGFEWRRELAIDSSRHRLSAG